VKPRVVFMGSPEFAVPALRALATACDVVRVVTQPDRPSGRGLQSHESAVARAARELELTALRPQSMRDRSVIAELRAADASIFAVVAFGAILTPEVLALPRAGCVNLHGSLLPDYRGASPVQHALWDGRTESGVCTLFMDEGIDTGDVIACRREPIRDDDDAGSLAARLAAIGGPLLAESVVQAAEGRAKAAGPRRRQLRRQAPQGGRHRGLVAARTRGLVARAGGDAVARGDDDVPRPPRAAHTVQARHGARGRAARHTARERR